MGVVWVYGGVCMRGGGCMCCGVCVYVWCLYVVCVHVGVGGCARWGVVCAAYCECGVRVGVVGVYVMVCVFMDQILLVYV